VVQVATICAAIRPHKSSAGSGVLNLVFVFGVVINELFLMFPYSSFNFVHHPIDRCVHVLFGVIGVDRNTIYMDRCFGFVAEFFDGQNTLDVRHEVKVTGGFVDFGFDVFSKRISNFDVVA
jgi:hypothetical protein